jgi:hypothetical protein
VKPNPDAGKITVVPGTVSELCHDPAGVNAWRAANGLDEISASVPEPMGELVVAGVVFPG